MKREQTLHFKLRKCVFIHDRKMARMPNNNQTKLNVLLVDGGVTGRHHSEIIIAIAVLCLERVGLSIPA